MSNLNKLIDSLKIDFIVFIENDFKPIEDAELILGYASKLNETELSLLIDSLNELGYNPLSEKIKTFFGNYLGLEHNEDDRVILLKVGKIKSYLERLNPAENEIINLCEDIIRDLTGAGKEAIRAVFFKYGIGDSLNNYEKIFEELDIRSARIPMRFYQTVVPAETPDFIKEIKITSTKYKSANYLCIVDKSLGESANEGLEFIKKTLPDVAKKTGVNPISFIFSSQPDENIYETLQDYYHTQLNKQSQTIIDEIVVSLAQCAYAKVFEKLCEISHLSSKEAANLVIRNHKNINHILSKAQAEGITPFEAIYSWYQLALDYKAHKHLTADYPGTFSLTKFFDNKFLPTYNNSEQIDTELLNLNTFEIFDYDVNRKHLPIASGDVFMKGEKYYVLVGQECDLLLREEENKRNSKTLELLEAKYESPEDTEKLTFSYNDKNKTIKIQNFVDSFNNRGSLVITSLTNNKSSNAELLDLCMFNNTGDSKLNLISDLSNDIKDVLPKGKDSYYKKLQELLTKIDVLKRDNPDLIEQFSFLDFNNFQFGKIENEIDFSIKRICRIKGNFKYFINKAFYDFRGRIDLNLVSNTEEKFDLKKIKISLPGILEKEIENVRIYQVGEKYHINKEEIISLVPEELKQAVNVLNNPIRIEDTNAYKIIITGDLTEIKLFFSINYNNKSRYVKYEEVDYKVLLAAGSIENKEIVFEDDGSIVSMINAEGKYKTFPIIDFRRAVKINHNGDKRIILENEKILIEDIAKPAAVVIAIDV